MPKNKDHLGRTLKREIQKERRPRPRAGNNPLLHTAQLQDGQDWGRLNLQSVTNESSLQEFLTIAELAQTEFTAEKMNIKYVKLAQAEVKKLTQPKYDIPLTVPRRPKWTPDINEAEQLDRERLSFLEWRRYLHYVKEKLGASFTPYEKNLELWKQLWRTLERSDVVLIFLDARNPLLLRCEDLEKYAAEHKCKCVLVLNKADLTSEYQRKCWANYFNKKKIPIVFTSALIPKEKKTEENDEAGNSKNFQRDSDTESEISDSNEDTNDFDEETVKNNEEELELFKRQLQDLDKAVTNTSDRLERIQEALDKVIENLRLSKPIETLETDMEQKENEETSESVTEDSASDVQNSHEILSREKIIEMLKSQNILARKNPPRITVGMIGYPNVGKSSTINALMQSKRVGVSSMPGYTRHIQTMILDEDIELLDCPGLVLPAYAVEADLLLSAVFPIDAMRSHDAAMTRLCQFVKKHTFEEKYGLLLPQDEHEGELDFRQILSAHAYMRGFMRANGQPDHSRSARRLLKDATNGVLLWEHLPPGCQPAPIDEMIEQKKKEKRQPTPREKRIVEGWVSKADEVDKAFFSTYKSSVHVKGKPIMGIQSQSNEMHQISKPWKKEKKHANKNKREKLRRVYAHLDEH